jgi:hypothetical protein
MKQAARPPAMVRVVLDDTAGGRGLQQFVHHDVFLHHLLMGVDSHSHAFLKRLRTDARQQVITGGLVDHRSMLARRDDESSPARLEVFCGCLNIGSGRFGVQRDSGLTMGRIEVTLGPVKRRYCETKTALLLPFADPRDS